MKKLLYSLLIILLIFFGVVNSNVKAEAEITLKEFTKLINYNYKHLDKINLGAFDQLLEENEKNKKDKKMIFKLYVEVYRNKNRLREHKKMSEEEIKKLDPLSPDETYILDEINLTSSNIINEEIFLLYIIEEKKSIPGYKLQSRINNTNISKEIKIPEREIADEYSWATTIPESKQNINQKIPFYFIEGIKRDSGIMYDIRENIDISKQANLYDLLIVFSYKIK